MVERNHDQERFARIEEMVERLQREQAAQTILTGKLIAAAVTKPSSVLVTYDRTRRKTAW
ncbi:MAG TPA: hypothetical protein VN654_00210 [Vicinamibacterales bacterium]|nr:hypothetical protein [Vicinamibacterales bacterium]